MKTATIQARVSRNLKKEVADILAEIGLDFSTAIRMYLKKIAQSKKIPFEMTAKEEKKAEDISDDQFWQAIADDNMKDVWGRPEEDVWDDILKKLPAIRHL